MGQKLYTTEELMVVRGPRRAPNGTPGLSEPSCKGSALQCRPRARSLEFNNAGQQCWVHCADASPLCHASACGASYRP